MPGKNWPTRVAWFFEVATRRLYPDPITGKACHKFTNFRRHSYIGRPNRYRALQARKFLKQTATADSVIMRSWQAEFDNAGLLAYKSSAQAVGVKQGLSPAFFAYHPHSSEAEVVEAFCKPLFLKYIGGMRLYSQKRKLSAEAVEAYYNWYYEQFKRKLRRPKAIATSIVAGEPLEDTEPQQ